MNATAAKLLTMRLVMPSPDRAQETPQNGHGVPTLLLIEAIEADRRTIRDVLADARGILDVEHVTTIEDGLARLAARSVSAVLLDLNLAEARDLSALDELRRVAPKVAVMILARA